MTFIGIQNQIVNGCMILLFLISISIQIIMGVHFYKLIRETENMTTTNDKFLKQCKLKFSHCYQLNIGVQNIPIFVDKLLQKIKIWKMPIRILKHMSGQAMLLSVFIAGYGACRGIILGETLSQILPYYIISLFGLYVYFSVSSMVDLSGKKMILKTNLIDYLENHMVNKLSTVEIDKRTINREDIDEHVDNSIGLVENKIVKLFQEQEKIDVSKMKTKDVETKRKHFYDKSVEKELEELLQEFLT
ncbi:MAG: hypothetical protein R3Y24_06275 [Eubacteriales bacterium]